MKRVKLSMQINDRERAERQDAIDQALASVRLEGLEPSDEAKAIFKRYSDGELSLEEMDEEIQAMNTRKYGSVHISGD